MHYISILLRGNNDNYSKNRDFHRKIYIFINLITMEESSISFKILEISFIISICQKSFFFKTKVDITPNPRLRTTHPTRHITNLIFLNFKVRSSFLKVFSFALLLHYNKNNFSNWGKNGSRFCLVNWLIKTVFWFLFQKYPFSLFRTLFNWFPLGGSGGIWTHVPITRQPHFECGSVRPLWYTSIYKNYYILFDFWLQL